MTDVFLDNKYSRWYHSIIRKAQQRIMEGYAEQHHIIPKCFYKMNSSWGTLDGDSEVADNKVILTIKEHYIAHLLLTKMVSDKVRRAQMDRALERCLNINNKGQKERYKIGSRRYQQIRQASAAANSVFISGDNNPQKRQEVRDKTSDTVTKMMQDPVFKQKHQDGVDSKSWRDARAKRVGKNAPCVDKAIYLLIHRDGRLLQGTQIELRNIIGASIRFRSLVKGEMVASYGWELFYSPRLPKNGLKKHKLRDK